ncbi:uncharacterized protein A4U43_C07F30990 [Asparagus officinalis]|uniref:Uncharacterized protein n=1 Tax=Asparagus officinalis TaxID=4686 RepID=A0A5P1EG95_ASPOF|nr:uncharacterized protein A4U43_C07F30990 [Asparagus officinalis]
MLAILAYLVYAKADNKEGHYYLYTASGSLLVFNIPKMNKWLRGLGGRRRRRHLLRVFVEPRVVHERSLLSEMRQLRLCPSRLKPHQGETSGVLAPQTFQSPIDIITVEGNSRHLLHEQEAEGEDIPIVKLIEG